MIAIARIALLETSAGGGGGGGGGGTHPIPRLAPARQTQAIVRAASN